eukprot:Colp12_sorted_trinity150504_noHs@28556
MNLAGFPVVLSDTAGMRESDDLVEREGIRRAKERLENCDLRICVFDSSRLEVSQELKDLIDENTIVIFNKADLLPATISTQELIHQARLEDVRPQSYLISCSSQAGLSEMLEGLAVRVKAMCEGSGSHTPALTQTRHRENLQGCVEALKYFMGKTVMYSIDLHFVYVL